jgi:hypothetical protein
MNEEFFCSSGSGGVLWQVVQAGSYVDGRTLSALYLALPKRLPRHPLPRLIAAKRDSCKIEVIPCASLPYRSVYRVTRCPI